MTGCRMAGYVAESPIRILNDEAKLRAVACVDKSNQFIER